MVPTVKPYQHFEGDFESALTLNNFFILNFSFFF